MNKKDLIDAIASLTDMKKTAVEEVLDTLGNVAASELARGEDVPLPGLGKLAVKTRAARTARNPKTGEAVEVPAKRVAHFSAAKVLKDAVA